MHGQSFRLAQEVGYIERRAAQHDGRWVTLGPVVLFSTDSGEAWWLDPSHRLAVRLARGGDPEPVYIDETDTNFTIAWTGDYRIEGDAFVYTDRDSGRVVTILGYPTDPMARLS